MRGTDTNLYILDETGYLRNEVLEVISPTFKLDAFGCIVSSTIGESDEAMFNRMLNEPKFMTYIKKYICESCESLGVTDRACIHREADRPPWFNPDEDHDDFIRRMFGTGGAHFQRDVLGVVRRDYDKHVFRADKVDELLRKPRTKIYQECPLLFIAIDPCNGTEDPDALVSHYCITAFTEPNILVGCEAVDAPRSEIAYAALEKFIRAVLEKPQFKRSTIVVDIENNGNSFSADLDFAVISRVVGKNSGRLIQMNTYSGARKQGTITTPKLKKDMSKLMQELLLTGKLSIMEDFITHTPEFFEMFEKQFKQYEKIVTVGKTPLDPPKVKMTGKHHGPDDICMTVQRIVYCAYNFFKSKEGQDYFSRI